MTWVKLPDDALDDPKVADVAPDAIIAYLRTLGWSNRWARDGRIPRSVAGETAETWIAAELATDSDDGVQLVWLLEHQPRADEIEKRRRDAADRQERHRRHMASDHSKCDPKRCHVLLRKDPATRDTTRDKRALLSDSVPSLPEGRGEETDDGNGLPEAAPPVVSDIEKRRLLARAIREASNDLHRQRYRHTFEREYGQFYGRLGPGVASAARHTKPVPINGGP